MRRTFVAATCASWLLALGCGSPGVDVDAGTDVAELPACISASDCDDAITCTTDACDAGTCTHAPVAVACDDGVACTTDTCSATSGCVHTADDAVCGDGVDCTNDVCNPDTGCESAPDDTACDDGVACTTDACDATLGCGHVTDDAFCADTFGCTTDSCDATLGCVYAADNGACADTVACTVDVCDVGAGCVNAPANHLCNDSVGCTVDTCDAIAGCGNALDHAACVDAHACTIDTCTPGGCSRQTNHPACEDGFACTLNTCSTGAGCTTSTSDLACDDHLECTAETCSASTGCSYASVNDGVACWSSRGACNGANACIGTVSAGQYVSTLPAFNRLGSAVAMDYYDGAIGAPQPSPAEGHAGRAFVIVGSHPTGSDSTYTLGAELVPPGTPTYAYGSDVASSGALFVSDPVVTVGGKAGAGAVHVFRRLNGNGAFAHSETLSSASVGTERFGARMDARYGLVLVREQSGAPSTSAYVHVYRCITSCTFVQTLGGDANFGSALSAMSSDRFAIGDTAAVNVYTAPDASSPFTLAATLEAPAGVTASFGRFITATTYHVFVGVPMHQVVGAPQLGSVIVYSANLNGTDFTYSHTITGSDLGHGAIFGRELHAFQTGSATRLAVTSVSTLAGGNYVHLFDTGTYRRSTPPIERAALHTTDEESMYSLGDAVVISGAADVVMGAPMRVVAPFGNIGSLYTFEWANP